MTDILEVKERAQEDNARHAEAVKKQLRSKGVFLVNLMASPGAGKTTVLKRLITDLKDRYRIGVMEADVDSSVDADAVAELGVKVLQLHTAGLCHMDADMTERGLEALGMDGLDLIFLENIGNLVCPAEFDVGAQLKLMMLSVPEGDDKPLKYPLMFQVSDCLLVNKIDTMAIFDFDVEVLRERVRAINPGMPVFEVSAKNGDGMAEFSRWFAARIEEARS